MDIFWNYTFQVEAYMYKPQKYVDYCFYIIIQKMRDFFMALMAQ